MQYVAGLANHFRPDEAADRNDPPLINDLINFAMGSGPEELSDHYARWVEALARIRVQERHGACLLRVSRDYQTINLVFAAYPDRRSMDHNLNG